MWLVGFWNRVPPHPSFVVLAKLSWMYVVRLGLSAPLLHAVRVRGVLSLPPNCVHIKPVGLFLHWNLNIFCHVPDFRLERWLASGTASPLPPSPPGILRWAIPFCGRVEFTLKVSKSKLNIPKNPIPSTLKIVRHIYPTVGSWSRLNVLQKTWSLCVMIMLVFWLLVPLDTKLCAFS